MVTLRRAGLGPRGLLVFAWGIGGLLALLVEALVRLVPIAVEAARVGLDPIHALVGALWVGGMAWTEGWVGFHQRFAPRAAVRAEWLARHPRPLLVLLAPLLCMGLIHARRRRLVASWALLGGIALAILLVRLLPQPWRGVADAGVVAGLAIGALSTGWWAAMVLLGRPPAVAAELPDKA